MHDAEWVNDKKGRAYVVFDDGVEYHVLLGFEFGDSSNESDIIFVLDEENEYVLHGFGFSRQDVVDWCIGARYRKEKSAWKSSK